MSRTLRRLAQHIAIGPKTGTPLRHGRGVVVSSTIGTSVVTPDGGATNITAFNYGHSQSLPAGAVVDVLYVGRKAYVVGGYWPVGLPGKWSQQGSTSATILNGSSQVGGSVTYSSAFPNATDQVFVNVQANVHNYAVVAYGFTASGFSYVLFTTNAGTVGTNVTWTINWQAWGH